jgi:hypothetical protein
MVVSDIFEWIIFAVVLVDISLIIAQLTVTDHLAGIVLRYINSAVVGIYTCEAILKVCYVSMQL